MREGSFHCLKASYDLLILMILPNTSVELNVVQFHRLPRNWCLHSSIPMEAPAPMTSINLFSLAQSSRCRGSRYGELLHFSVGSVIWRVSRDKLPEVPRTPRYLKDNRMIFELDCKFCDFLNV